MHSTDDGPLTERQQYLVNRVIATLELFKATADPTYYIEATRLNAELSTTILRCLPAQGDEHGAN